MLVFLRCVCVWVCVCVCGCVGVFVGVYVCGCGMLICFVSALGSHEMGCHKLPIIKHINRIGVGKATVTQLLFRTPTTGLQCLRVFWSLIWSLKTNIYSHASVKRRKLAWFGHIKRHNSLSKTILHGT